MNLLLLILSTMFVGSLAELKVGSFNIQVFGRTKMEDPQIRQTLTKILRRYDICLIMEIRDSSHTAIYELLDAINSNLPAVETYNMAISDRYGRSHSKEQYAYLYKPSKVKVIDSYTYADDMDEFERPPFLVKLNTPETAAHEFFFIGLHSKPDDTPSEVDKLLQVYHDGVNRFGTKNAIIMGDLNADCRYFTNDEIKKSKLANYPMAKWILPFGSDTTTKSTDCAYDRVTVFFGVRMKVSGICKFSNVISDPNIQHTLRFIAFGEMQNAVQNYAVFHFGHEYKLTEEQVYKVSDHYPIELKLV